MCRATHMVMLVFLLFTGFIHGHATAAATHNAQISIANKEAAPGDIVDVPVTVSGFEDVYVLQLQIAFNDDVLKDASIENLHGSISSATTNPDSNPIVISWFNLINGLNLPDDTKLFDLRFTFCENADDCAIHNFFCRSELCGKRFLHRRSTTWVYQYPC